MRRLRALAAVAVLLSGCGGPLVRRGAVNQPFVDDITSDMIRFRGLALKSPVPARTLGAADMAAAAHQEITASFNPGDLERIEAVERHLGLLGPTQQLTTAFTRIFQQQIAGFYDPRSKTFTIARDTPSAGGIGLGFMRAVLGYDPMGELVAAHELTHALQDQYFGIPIDPEPLLDSHGDRLLAQRALFEGDATLAGFARVVGSPIPEAALEQILLSLRGMPDQLDAELPDVPPIIRTPLAFQYNEGTHFAVRGFQTGGWAQIDQAHRDPPVSSEQILHPERYWEQREDPTPLTLGAAPLLERAGWQPILEDTLGELTIRVMLHDALGAPAANAAADGWNGDRLRAYQRGDAIVSLWLSTWSDPAAAEELASGLRHLWPSANVDVRGAHVLVVLADPQSGVALRPVSAAVWESSRVAGLRPR